MEEEEELKASGNAAFKKGDFASAVDFFSRAIDVSSKKNNIENHHVLYSNRSAARVRRNRQSRLFIHRKWSLFSGERFFFIVVDRMRFALLVGRFGRFYHRRKRWRRTSFVAFLEVYKPPPL